MDYESHVGNHPQDVRLVAKEELLRVVVAAGQKYLRAGTLTGHLLALVQGVLDGIHVLLEHQLVEFRQICGIVAHRVFHQKDCLHAALEYVMFGVERVFQQLDDGQEQVGRIVPAEDIVDGRGVAVVYLAVQFAGEGSEQHHRHFGRELLEPAGELENVHLAHVVHRYGKVETLAVFQQRERFEGGFHPHEYGGIAEVEFGVLAADLRFHAAVLLK